MYHVSYINNANILGIQDEYMILKWLLYDYIKVLMTHNGIHNTFVLMLTYYFLVENACLLTTTTYILKQNS